MESRRMNILNKRPIRSALVGALAVGATLLSPVEASAQLFDPRPVGEIDRPKPKPIPLLVPRPETKWVDPDDLDQLIGIASLDMGIPPSSVRRIIMCESEGDPTKINPKSGARGLWQIMPLHAEKFIKRGWDYWRDWSNGYRNTKVAVDIMEKQGLSAWDCS